MPRARSVLCCSPPHWHLCQSPQLRLQSRAGTLAFFVAGGLAAFAALLYATANGLVSEELHWGEAARLATVCSAVGAVVESLPLPLDNLTVPAAVALAAHFLGRS